VAALQPRSSNNNRPNRLRQVCLVLTTSAYLLSAVLDLIKYLFPH
jgi:hypothetical protein